MFSCGFGYMLEAGLHPGTGLCTGLEVLQIVGSGEVSALLLAYLGINDSAVQFDL